jgi:hypothetical protein
VSAIGSGCNDKLQSISATNVLSLGRGGSGRMADIRPPAIDSATASPIAAECLNPWPEQAETTITLGWLGWRSIMKRLPRALVYRQGTVRSGSAPTQGKRRARQRS